MIDYRTLQELLQDRPGGLEPVKQEEEDSAKELTVLARILIDAVREKMRHGKTN